MNKKFKKETLQSINIKPVLKRFMEKKKLDFKEETGEFHGMTAVLMRYLEGNTDFLMDFQTYCKEKREKENIPGPEKILEQDKGDLLGLLTKVS